MAAEMLQKVLEAEKEAELIITEAHSEAENILKSADEKARQLRAKMLENVKAQLDAIDKSISENAQTAQLDAEKRAKSQAEKLDAAVGRLRPEIVGKLIKVVSEG